MKTAIFDTEGDGLLDTTTKLHVLGIKDYEKGHRHVFREDNIREGLAMLESAEKIVGHNILGHDLLVMEKLYGYVPQNKIFDTLVATRLLFPTQKEKDMNQAMRGLFPGNLIGRYSLEAWGHRLGMQKGDYKVVREAKAKELGITDPDEVRKFVWGSWNQDMEDYGMHDVDVTEALFTKVMMEIEMTSYPSLPLETEHMMADLMATQELNGIPFNVKEAERMLAEMQAMVGVVEEECQTAFPPRFRPVGQANLVDIRHAFNKVDWEKLDNEELENAVFDMLAEGNNEDLVNLIEIPKKTLRFKDPARPTRHAGSPYTPVEYHVFSPGSRPQIGQQLISLGWIPDEFTEKGSPSVNEDALLRASESIPIAKPINDYLLINKRISQLATGNEGWLQKVTEKGFIHHNVVACGAVTGRATHRSPNLAQVPKVVKKKRVLEDGKKEEYIAMGREGGWGYESRALFHVPAGFKMVGCDLSGIELRCLAHYMAQYDGGEYGRILLNGDIHSVNQEAAGLESRDQAKTMIYALCMPTDSTQALTKTGWKFRKDLSVGEEILAYDSQSKTKKWAKITSFADYNGAEVVRIRNKQFDVECTRDHRWFVKQRRQSGKMANSIRFSEHQIRRTFELNTESNIIANAPMADDQDLKPSALCVIDQKYDVDWTLRVLQMSQTERVAFLEGFLIADGYRGEKTSGWLWTQNSGSLSEAAITASYLVHDGYLNIRDRTDGPSPMKVCTLNAKAHVTCQKMEETESRVTDVFCPNTEYGSWVCRQGNTITITGNCYGAGDEKLGSIVAPLASSSEQKRIGKDLKVKLLSKIPALNSVLKAVKKDLKTRGFMEGLDGRRLYARSEHSALNTLLQSAGALIAKYWLLEIDDEINYRGYQNQWVDYANMLWIHDEVQYAVREQHAEEFAKVMVESAAKAGKFLNFNLPVDAEAKIGLNWAECH